LPERSPGGSRAYSYAMSMGVGRFSAAGKIPARPALARLDSFSRIFRMIMAQESVLAIKLAGPRWWQN
jgi:hypothetical protein